MESGREMETGDKDRNSKMQPNKKEKEKVLVEASQVIVSKKLQKERRLHLLTS